MSKAMRARSRPTGTVMETSISWWVPATAASRCSATSVRPRPPNWLRPSNSSRPASRLSAAMSPRTRGGASDRKSASRIGTATAGSTCSSVTSPPGARPPRADSQAEGQARRAPQGARASPAPLQRAGSEALRAEPCEDQGGTRQGQQGIAGNQPEDAGNPIAAPRRVRVSRLDLAVPPQSAGDGRDAMNRAMRKPSRRISARADFIVTPFPARHAREDVGMPPGYNSSRAEGRSGQIPDQSRIPIGPLNGFIRRGSPDPAVSQTGGLLMAQWLETFGWPVAGSGNLPRTGARTIPGSYSWPACDRAMDRLSF